MPRRRRSRVSRTSGVAFAIALALALTSIPLSAHVIPGSATLSQLTRAASVVAVTKITNPHAMIELGDAKLRRFVVEAEILEVLRGDIAEGPVKFMPHGHGAEGYEAGEETLIFLQPIEQNPELAKTRIATAVRFAGIDEVSDRITLRRETRGTYLDAARAYAAVASEPAETQKDALRRTTLRLLASKEPRLAGFALKDLALSEAGPDPLVTVEDLPALIAVFEDPSRPLSLRVGLLSELERRKLVEGGDRWVKLLKAAPPAELSTVARVAGRRALPEVTAELVRLMNGENEQTAKAAAAALGVAGNEAAVEPLGRAVWGVNEKVRWAALQSLGRIASPAARAALSKAATEHPDAETRRAAQTGINLLAARQIAPSASGEAANPNSGPSRPAAPISSAVAKHWAIWAILSAIALAACGILLRRRLKRGPTAGSAGDRR